MALEVVTPPEHLSSIMADLSRRRTNINSVSMRGKAQVIKMQVMFSCSMNMRDFAGGDCLSPSG